jgi:hypothetical protein
MPRAVANKLYRTFVKGLITEAGPLTYPENASIDEDNCVISRKGNRYRRFGFDLEKDFRVPVYYLNDTADFSDPHKQLSDVAIKTFKWEAVAQTNANFLVYQQGRYLQFTDMATVPLSSGVKPYFVDLNSFLAPGQSDPSLDEVSFTAGKGHLFVAHPKLDPFYITYDPNTDSITTSRITIQIRDLIGLYDSLANDEEPTSLSAEHNYNLLNQGWIQTSTATAAQGYYDDYGNYSSYTPTSSLDPISSYYGAAGKYPGNNKQWWVGKAISTGNFDVNLLNSFYAGNNRAPRGHFIVNAFQLDRSAISGIPGLPVESTSNRPVSVAFFSGRAWYGTHGAVYFSQILDDVRKAGFCYQDADPTSEVISDLIATDGGVVPIPEMGRCIRLLASGAGVLVFATNGIWFISGNTSGFSATDISITKVSSVGTDSPNSIVEAELSVYWWSPIGIMQMKQQQGFMGPIDGKFDHQNIAQTTIQTFYNDEVSELSRPYVTAVYDPASNVIQWLYKSSDVTARYRYNRILNLDLTLGAFYPWSIDSTVGAYIVGVFPIPQVTKTTTHDNVTVGGSPVTSSTASVISELDNLQLRVSQIKYLCLTPASGNLYFTCGDFTNSNFCDWQTVNGIGWAYNSYIETGYELLEDAMRKKQTPYVFCYFRRTETGFVSAGQDYAFDKPSSCTFQTKWDWASSAVSNKWSRAIEAYRFTRMPAFNPGLEFDTGFPIVITKNKVRGSGRAVQFRFSNNQIGSDFDLLGWAVEYVGNTQP